MTAKLRISDGLSLPLDCVTQTFGVLAKRRAGKSYLAARFVEELWAAKQQVVMLDPKGDSWGLRSSADGKAQGIPILILGGEHGDVRLEPSSGEIVARMVVEERVSAILDLSEFRKHEVATFSTAFLETLYRTKAKEQFRTAMMLVVDEADAIAPQRPQRGEERMLGAIEDVVRRGGQRGIGCFMATQRAAVINKNILTQVQVLVALRTIAPQDLAAMEAWIDVHGTPAEREELMASLPSLPTGTAWFWSPGWPTEKGIFACIKVSPRSTFDSGATPKPGETKVAPKTVADVDLGAVQKRMAATIEKAKADDPKELRKKIAELERALTHKALATAAPKAERVEVKVPFIPDKQLRRLESLGNKLGGLSAKAGECAIEMKKVTEDLLRIAAANVVKAARPLPTQTIGLPDWPKTPWGFPKPSEAPTRRPAKSNGASDASVGTSGLRRMLIALAQRPHGLTNRQLGVRAGVSSRSGTFSTYLSKARTNGWLDGSGTLRITDDGIQALGSYDPLPMGQELLGHWVHELGGGASRMLQVLAEVYPQELTNEELGERAEISHRSGTFSTYLSRLRTLELVEGRGTLRASKEFFE